MVPVDHPRSRGVYLLQLGADLPGQGSSPLARGLPPAPWIPIRRARIIPARAGFTHEDHLPQAPVADHPRSRGVYAGSRRCRCHPWGSSPLARGLLLVAGDPHDVLLDHPRSRGVYCLGLAGIDDSEGSSPLARGLRIGLLWRSGGRGIIPARAGFTRRNHARNHRDQDHPRSRGVYERVSGAVMVP